MNRRQAENILDAYVLLSDTENTVAFDALREVILDAMTSVRYYPMTMPQPRVDPYKPVITWCEEAKSNAD